MRQLFLVRHARARASPGIDDHERPLEAGGLAAATQIGAHLARRGAVPSLILCSSSRRAVETLDRLRAELPDEPAVQIERRLYMAQASLLLARLAGVADREGAVLLVGHNPGIEDLARGLVGNGDRQAIGRLRAQFPPAACAAFRFELASWRELALGGGHLVEFTTPRDLA